MLQVVLGSGGESTWNFSGLTGKSCGTPNYQEASLGQIVHIQFRTGAEAAITTQYLQRKVLERIMALQTCMKSCTLMAVLQRHVLHIQSNFCRDGWHVTDGNKLQTSLPHSRFSFFWGEWGDCFQSPILHWGRPPRIPTSTFQPGEDMPKYHREGCSGWYFCLRLKAEVLQV